MLDPSEIAKLRERLDASGRGSSGYGPNKLTPAIAKHFGVRRQTVDYHLRRFARG